MMAMPPIESPEDIIALWDAWCGETAWTRSLARFGELGGMIRYWCGVPRSASAIPLTFELFHPDGSKIPSNSRLKDIRKAIAILESEAA